MIIKVPSGALTFIEYTYKFYIKVTGQTVEDGLGGTKTEEHWASVGGSNLFSLTHINCSKYMETTVDRVAY